MKVEIKCNECDNKLILEEKDLKKLKRGIQYKKGDKINIYSTMSEYFANKNYYGKYVKCPICNEKVFLVKDNCNCANLIRKDYNKLIY